VANLVFTIRNDLDGLAEAADAAISFLEANHAPREVVFTAHLAIEEIVSNTIKYGYQDTRRHEMTIRLTLTESALEIEITDDGKAFNPFAHPQPDFSLPSDLRPIGGLGIHFVRHMLDTCAYVRRDGQNIVRLTKKL
jgi:serine/threonine-protein kinase RsbW